MNKNSNPIEFAIEFAWANGCDLFTINNAKDELKKLKNQSLPESNDAIDQLLNICETVLNTGKWNLTPSLLYNAKYNLEQLRIKLKELYSELYKANHCATEEIDAHLDTFSELRSLKKSLASPVAWAKINTTGDLYDIRLQNNPYDDQDRVIPLYKLNQ